MRYITEVYSVQVSSRLSALDFQLSAAGCRLSALSTNPDLDVDVDPDLDLDFLLQG
jgi:hypothetical protein